MKKQVAAAIIGAVLGTGSAVAVASSQGSSVTLQPGQSITINAAPAAPTVSDTGPPAALMPNSIFDQNVTGWAVDPNSASLVAEFNQDWQANYGSVGVSGRPIIFVPANQPEAPIALQSGCNSDGITQAPIPAYWTNSEGGGSVGDGNDAIATFYQPSSGNFWEFWQFHSTGSGYSACWGGTANLATFTGVFPSPFGETATGISNLATEVTNQDVASGSIDHAIGLQIVNCNGFEYPADRGDCGSDPGTPAEGTWFRFSSSVDCGNYTATAFQHLVCVAGQDYGFVVVDHAGADQIEADFATNDYFGGTGRWEDNPAGGCCIWEGSNSPLETSMETTPGNNQTEAQEYKVIATLPWSQLQVVDPPS